MSDDPYYMVRFKLKDRFLDEEDDFVYDLSGEIILDPDGLVGSKETVIGKIHAERIDLGAAYDQKASVMEIFDSSSELYEVYVALFNLKTDGFLDALELETPFGDILVIHSIEVIPEYRGRNLGLLAMLQTIKTFGGGCVVAAIKPFPLQFTGKVTDDNEAEFNRGQKKLRDHWKKLGFKRAMKTDFYYMDLTLRLPRVRKFILPGSVAKK